MYMNSQTCPYPVIPLTLTSPIPECFALFIARSIANLPMAGPFFPKENIKYYFMSYKYIDVVFE